MYAPGIKNIAAAGLVAGLAMAAAAYAQAGQTKDTSHKAGTMSCCSAMPSAKPLPAASATHTLKITATMPSAAKEGDNALDIVITDAAGKPITAAKVTAEVAMTSMDMGTTSPSVKEVGKGHYATTAAFSMAGPWRVTVKVVAPGKKQESKSFDFTAG